MPLRTGIAAVALALTFAGAVFVYATFGGPAETAAVKAATQDAGGPPERSDPGVDPRKEPKVAPRLAEEPEAGPTRKPEEPRPDPKEQEPAPAPEPKPEPEPEPKPEPEREPKPESKPEPPSETYAVPDPRPDDPAPPQDDGGPEPVAEEPGTYRLPDGAVMALTVDALGLREVPVFDSTAEWALKHGVGHDPDTSLPWTDDPHRNVYVAGHRIGFPGTNSDRVFDGLGDLVEGDGVVLRGGEGKRYRYEVTESFVASPEDTWVTSRVRDRDMVTLQTCVGPNFSERLVVRAERV